MHVSLSFFFWPSGVSAPIGEGSVRAAPFYTGLAAAAAGTILKEEQMVVKINKFELRTRTHDNLAQGTCRAPCRRSGLGSCGLAGHAAPPVLTGGQEGGGSGVRQVRKDTRSGAQARAHRPRDLRALRTGRQRATTATSVHATRVQPTISQRVCPGRVWAVESSERARTRVAPVGWV